jgi:two-component system NtrC family sensor kinase
MSDTTPAGAASPHQINAPGQPTPVYGAAGWRESDETRFEALLEAAPDSIVIVDTDGRIMIVNSQTERLFGYTKQELLGQTIETLLPESLRGIHTRHRAQYVAEPHTRPMGSGLDLVARRKDGSIFPVEISLSAIRTNDGMLFTSIVRDVTERKRAADELARQAEALRAQAAELEQAHDERARQAQLHASHLDTLIAFSQELLSTPTLDIVLQRAMSRALDLAHDAQCGAIYLYDTHNQRLALRASSGFAQLPDFSQPVDLGLIAGAFTTQRIQLASSAEECAELGQRFNGRRESQTPPFNLPAPPTGMLAIPLIARDEAVGVLVLLRLEGEGAFASEARTTLEGLANLAAAAILEEGSARTVATLSSRLAALEEQQRSLNERVSWAEVGMLQAARLAAVGQLAAAVAHEINNPLYAARNSLYLLEDDLPAELRESPYLGIARDQLARIARIIERMRDFYRPDRGEMSPYNINHLLEETIALAGLALRHSPIQMIFAPDAGLAEVVCNADQLRQVFLNLIINAGEAMPDGGTLTVRTSAGPTVAVVEIQDTGIGIPAGIRERLFEPFFTNKPNGTGLGLSISAHIVTQHGGQIEVESREGEGSTFRIVLPYQAGR